MLFKNHLQAETNELRQEAALQLEILRRRYVTIKNLESCLAQGATQPSSNLQNYNVSAESNGNLPIMTDANALVWDFEFNPNDGDFRELGLSTADDGNRRELSNDRSTISLLDEIQVACAGEPAPLEQESTLPVCITMFIIKCIFPYQLQ